MAEAALEKKAFDFAILDLQGLVAFTDIFVVCSATNRRQVRAVADEVCRVAKREFGLVPAGVEGLEAGRWVLVDLHSVVVHIFDQSLRGFYDLDGLWGDAPRLATPIVYRKIDPAPN